MKFFTPKNGFTRMSKQYAGGILAGLGGCAIIMRAVILHHGSEMIKAPLFLIPCFALLALGSSLALKEQRQLESDKEEARQSK